MKITSTEVVVKPAVPAVTERKFMLALDADEVQALKRVANRNVSIPTLMQREGYDMAGVKDFLTRLYYELEPQKVGV